MQTVINGNNSSAPAHLSTGVPCRHPFASSFQHLYCISSLILLLSPSAAIFWRHSLTYLFIQLPWPSPSRRLPSPRTPALLRQLAIPQSRQCNQSGLFPVRSHFPQLKTSSVVTRQVGLYLLLVNSNTNCVGLQRSAYSAPAPANADHSQLSATSCQAINGHQL